ncbi:MAG: hypothetical protein IKE89_03480 [Bacilli bacterium]|nr:hypothetical protein [Bacilli bacterium]MBR2711513.1 hypothetical protein [Bacilli bacterium]
MIGDVVQFNENHKWCGSLGIITKMKEIHNKELQSEGKNDFRYMICVPIPQQGAAYIYVLQSEFALEFIGKAVLTPKENEDD